MSFVAVPAVVLFVVIKAEIRLAVVCFVRNVLILFSVPFVEPHCVHIGVCFWPLFCSSSLPSCSVKLFSQAFFDVMLSLHAVSPDNLVDSSCCTWLSSLAENLWLILFSGPLQFCRADSGDGSLLVRPWNHGVFLSRLVNCAVVYYCVIVA